MLSLAPKTALEALTSNPNQLSGISKHVGAPMVEALLTKLLHNAFSLTATHFSPDQLAMMAAQIRTAFWMLRMEEIIYAINKGVNGQYGKVFGNLTYIHISEWINLYIAQERDTAIHQQRVNEQKEAQKDFSQWEGIDLAPLIEKFNSKPENKPYEPPKVTAEQIDTAQYQHFIQFQSLYTDSELSDMLINAERSHLTQTYEAIRSEIARRTQGKG